MIMPIVSSSTRFVAVNPWFKMAGVWIVLLAAEIAGVIVAPDGRRFHRIFAALMHLVPNSEKFSLSCPESPMWRDRSVWVANSCELVSLDSK